MIDRGEIPERAAELVSIVEALLDTGTEQNAWIEAAVERNLGIKEDSAIYEGLADDVAVSLVYSTAAAAAAMNRSPASWAAAIGHAAFTLGLTAGILLKEAEFQELNEGEETNGD